jgi:cell division protein FtsB
MAHLTAPEPPDGPTEPGLPDPQTRGDLSAIPTFLRGRATGVDTDRHPGEPVRPIQRATPVPSEIPGLAAMPLAGISPRRLLQIVAIVAIAWGVVSFGRQVASATAASVHAAELREANNQLQDQVSAMQRELTLIQERRYIDQQARAYRLGTAREIPFVLAAGAPALGGDAPGSAANRLGAPVETGSPLDHWLALLFGPG